MMLRDSELAAIRRSKTTFKIFHALDQLETKWNESQHILYLNVLKDAEETQEKENARKDKLLEECIEHGGPFKTVDAMMKALEKLSDEKQKRALLKTEIIYRKKSDFNKQLNYGVNKKSIDELTETLENLMFFSASNSSQKGQNSSRTASDVLKDFSKRFSS